MKAILERCSIRSYTKEKIEKEDIKKILRAGMSAPSACNRQPWEFIVVEDKEKLKEMSTLTPYAGMLKGAAMGMVVAVNTKNHLNIEYDLQDCAAATENMLVEANHLNIGSCWLGGYPNEDRIESIRNYFSLPDYIMPLWMISFGYPNEDKKIKNKWNEDKIHWEKY